LWLSQNKLEQARSELMAFTLRRGSSAEGWLKLGTVQLRSKELAGAEKSLSEAIRLSPQNPEAITELGLVRLRRGRAAEAVQLFAKALQQQPGYRPALLNWAIVAQENLHDPNLALQKYRDYLALKPVPENTASVSLIVRQLEQELAPPTSPKPAVTTAVALPSTNAVKIAQSEVAHSTSSPKAEVPESVHTLASPKSESTSNVSKLSVATNIVKTTPAPAPAPPPDTNFEVVKLAPEPVFKTAADIAASPPHPEPAPALVVTSIPPPSVSDSKPPPKRSFFQKINPINLFSAQDKTGHQPQPQKEPGSAAGPLPDLDAKAVSSSPGRYAYRSPAKPDAGNHSEAERSFAQALQAQQAQQLPEAIQAYRRAIQTDPAYFDAYYNLGLVAGTSDNLQLSLNGYEIALAIRPESSDARYNFALGLKQANYPIDAANELEKLLAISPNESRAHLALGNLYAQQLGQPVKARQHYQKVLEIDPRNPQAPAVRYWLTANPK
jgi:tetratricopeptide (TPR) repeat protein